MSMECRLSKDITPFFLISLIEHKSDVEYHMPMQIFRYMIYIWEKCERRYMVPVHETIP